MKPLILTCFVILFGSFGLIAQTAPAKDNAPVGGMKWKQHKSSDTKTRTYKGIPNNQKRDSRPIRKENRK
jgi:hypothetical protein